VGRQMLQIEGELQLDIVTLDDQPFPFRFETVCRRCGQTVAITIYTSSDEHDPTIDERISQDATKDILIGVIHQKMCVMGGLAECTRR
jgi:hypothetical protein